MEFEKIEILNLSCGVLVTMWFNKYKGIRNFQCDNEWCNCPLAKKSDYPPKDCFIKMIQDAGDWKHSK